MCRSRHIPGTVKYNIYISYMYNVYDNIYIPSIIYVSYIYQYIAVGTSGSKERGRRRCTALDTFQVNSNSISI